MILVFDKSEVLQAVLSNDGAACPYYITLHTEKINLENTFTFSIPADHDDAQYVVEGSLVAFKDLDSNWQLFEVKRIVDTDDSATIKQAYCDHAFYELLGDIVPSGGVNNASAWLAVTSALSQSRWEVGNVANLGNQTTVFDYQTALGCLQQVATTWQGELQFRITVANNIITHRYVDLVARRGNTTGKQFVFGKDLLKVAREVDFNNVYTAMYGRGQATTSGERLNFASINGGKEYVEDVDALALYGIKGTRHRFGIFDDSQESDPAALLAKTQAALELAKVPIVSYEFDTISLEQLSSGYSHEAVRIGDITVCIDNNFSPPLQLMVRVIEIQRDLLEPDKTKITLGSFRQDLASGQYFQNQINRQVQNNSGIWDNAAALVPSVLGPAIYDLTSELRSAGGYVVFSDTDGIMIYDTPDPSTATKAMKLGGGIFGIADSKDPVTGDWDWRTFGNGGGFTADLITAGRLLADRVQIGAGTLFDHGYAPSDALNDFISTIYNSDLADIQSQLDGNITSWFYAYPPTLLNEPASLWTTTTLKDEHKGDLFYDTLTGYAYRFVIDGGVYSWNIITDSGVTEAMAVAAAAQDTADNKRRVFTVQPTTPYDAGDLWSTNGSLGDLMLCIQTKAVGSYLVSDWDKASKYTDDTTANQALIDAATAQEQANTAASDAAAANTLLADIANDNKLTPVEKQALQRDREVIDSEVPLFDAQATSFGITTEKTDYDNAYSTLNSYLDSLEYDKASFFLNSSMVAIYDSLSTTTDIVDTIFRAYFKAYYDARTVLLNAISTKAKTLANAAQATADAAVPLTDIEQGNIDFLISATNKISVNSNFYWDASGFYAVNGGNVVRITSGGIGIGTAGVGGAFSTAITGAGIVASAIKSGTLDCSLINVTNLSASSITSGTISADRISGGTLTGVIVKTATSNYLKMEGSTLRGYNGTTLCLELAVNPNGSYNLPTLSFKQNAAQGGETLNVASMFAGGYLSSDIDTFERKLYAYQGADITGNVSVDGNINASGHTITATTFSGKATSATSADKLGSYNAISDQLTIAPGSYYDYYHGLGRMPLYILSGTLGNIQLTTDVNISRIRLYNYSSGSNSWTGKIYAW